MLFSLLTRSQGIRNNTHTQIDTVLAVCVDCKKGARRFFHCSGLTLFFSFVFFGQIYSRGELHHFIDGFNEEKSNWMRYVNPAHSAREQNLAACQNGMNVYFYTIKPIPANQELLVWYCRDFAGRLHYPYPGELTMMNLSKWITEQENTKMPVMSALPL